MKILHVTNAVGWSGGMEQISLLISELQKRGHENILVCPPNSQLIEKVSHLGILIQLLPMFQDYDLYSAWKLQKLIRFYSPGIVHAHHAIAHAIALLSLSFSKTPPLLVARRVSFPPKKNPFSLWKYRSSRINQYVVVSRAIKQTLVDGGVEDSKIEVIYSGVDLKKFSCRNQNKELKKTLQIPDGVPIVGKVANFFPWKGHHILLEAAKKILSRDPKIIFLFVGRETESLLPLVERLGIGHSVRLLGFRRDIPEILSILDVSVNASIEGEGLSGALRESLAMEIPVVASDVSGNREIVREGETGFLVSPNDPDLLSEKIITLLKDYPRAKEMAKKGREWVVQNSSSDRVIESFLKLYSSLINRGRN